MMHGVLFYGGNSVFGDDAPMNMAKLLKFFHFLEYFI